eukprot:993122-Rhodomonas_salina.1
MSTGDAQLPLRLLVSPSDLQQQQPPCECRGIRILSDAGYMFGAGSVGKLGNARICLRQMDFQQLPSGMNTVENQTLGSTCAAQRRSTGWHTDVTRTTWARASATRSSASLAIPSIPTLHTTPS